jgi:hypothetical protein
MMVGWENGLKDDQSARSAEKQIPILLKEESDVRKVD